MKEIDRGDVDISKLFNWGKKFRIDIPGRNKTMNVFVRLVGDADYNRATVYARRRSAELRKILKDENSDERIGFIPDITAFSKEVLVGTLLLFYTKEATLIAIREVKLDLPIEPKADSSLEELEKYQLELDEYPSKREQAIKDFVNKKIDEKKLELDGKDNEPLYKEYIRMAINQICEAEMFTRMREMCVYLGTYKDEDYTERMFKSFDEFDNLPENIKNQFITFYSAMEIDGDDLKKSPVAPR